MKMRFYAGLMAAIAMLAGGKKGFFEAKPRAPRPDACHMFALPTQYGSASLDWGSIYYARKRNRRAKAMRRR